MNGIPKKITGFSIDGFGVRDKDRRLSKVQTNRVSLVDRAANGTKFAIVKRHDHPPTASSTDHSNEADASQSLSRLRDLVKALSIRQPELPPELDSTVNEINEVVETISKNHSASQLGSADKISIAVASGVSNQSPSQGQITGLPELVKRLADEVRSQKGQTNGETNQTGDRGFPQSQT